MCKTYSSKARLPNAVVVDLYTKATIVLIREILDCNTGALHRGGEGDLLGLVILFAVFIITLLCSVFDCMSLKVVFVLFLLLPVAVHLSVRLNQCIGQHFAFLCFQCNAVAPS